MMLRYDAAIIGGGFYGCMTALLLKRKFPKVVLLEKESEILQRASFRNQARIHNGYHYPFNIRTALRSRVNFPRFISEFKDCVDDTVKSYYAISRVHSSLNATQFITFCKRIEAPLKQAPSSIVSLFQKDLIENVFEVMEYTFDSRKLKEKLSELLRSEGVELVCEAHALLFQQRDSHTIQIIYDMKGTERILNTKLVFHCAYSKINTLLRNSNLPLIPLKHEFSETPLVKVPPLLKQTAITVLCGPFFSIVPFPADGSRVHTLSHVRYTPHMTLFDSEHSHQDMDMLLRTIQGQSTFDHMVRDAARFLPVLKEAEYVRSLWEVKTILPEYEENDGRPILFRRNWGMPGLTCMLGAKIDTIYDALDYLQTMHQDE